MLTDGNLDKHVMWVETLVFKAQALLIERFNIGNILKIIMTFTADTNLLKTVLNSVGGYHFKVN